MVLLLILSYLYDIINTINKHKFCKNKHYEGMDMKVTDINQYLRYASIISHKPVNEYMYAQDYHFYYMLSSDIRVKIDDK